MTCRVADLRARRLPGDLPGPGRGCLTSDPDATFSGCLDLQQWASVLASAVALHSASELVVVEIRADDVARLRAYGISHERRAREQPEHDPADDAVAQVLVCDQPDPDSGHCVVMHVRPNSAVLAMDPGLFSAATRARFASHVEQLANADGPLGSCRLSAVTVARAQRSVAGSSELRQEADWGSCVIGRLLQVAQSSPEAAALTAGQHTLSYAELCSWIGGMAERIQAVCDRPARVGVLARHGLEAVVGALAALAAGAAYVPFDANLPDGRLRRIRRQAAPDLVVHGPDLAQRAQLLARAIPTVAVQPCAATLQAPQPPHGSGPWAGGICDEPQTTQRRLTAKGIHRFQAVEDVNDFGSRRARYGSPQCCCGSAAGGR